MRRILEVIPILFLSISCTGQGNNPRTTVSNDFNESPPILYGMPETLTWQDTSASWSLGDQQLLLTGIVYQADGTTPAANVILYYYQTNAEGQYLHVETEARSVPKNANGATHGFIRGWVETGKDGKYEIYTTRPGGYPSGEEVAHVHIYLTDPYISDTYYIDNFVFDDDPLLTTKRRRAFENRAGNGIVRLVQKENLQIAERDLFLGLNIRDYPIQTSTSTSGRSIGGDIFSFTPYHAWGPDKGTKTCPVCKYGWYSGVLYFVGNNPNWDQVKQWLTYLEIESERREKYLKVYFVYGNSAGFEEERRSQELAEVGRELKLEKVALTFVPSFADKKSEIYLNKINSDVSNTFLIYKRSKIIGKYIDLSPSEKNFKLISEKLDASVNDFFYLPRTGGK